MAALVFGYLTLDGKKVASLEEMALSVTRDEDQIFLTDEVEADELISTQLKYKLSIKKGYTNGDMLRVIQSGQQFDGIMFRKEAGSAKATPIRDLRGVNIIKLDLGPITGNKHALEDIDASVTRVIPLD